ncbi:hypothetical protein EDC44_10458 [Cricetibacter osteomyelitidis]|uniref:Lipoprotein n=1 Tax=Cricetibacter osteomyelitidis TaxID=1521931 RepID=A0A4R2T3F5_9PAST|nr:hypothetical protein [Cricetibacter osteomyelitidis]TCP96525.1 hypothetical protein EDC44_10458 [Cricetibacter osteomyelitidis]
MLRNVLICLVFFMSSCLPLEPSKGGVTYYNYCNTEVVVGWDDNTFDNFSLKPNQAENRFFTYNDEVKVAFEKRYFIKNGLKNRFHIEQYLEARYNLIACPENAKPTGDGNWIRAK